MHQYDYQMDAQGLKLKPEHVNVDTDWLTFELQRDDGHSNLVYYPTLTINQIADAVRLVRQLKQVIRIP